MNHEQESPCLQAGEYVKSCVIRSRLREYHFGRFLTRSEKEWLVGEIKAFLEKLHQ
ncbi:MAG: hypothetical protein F6J86_04510 [Symploca sp. SIO1B1]|nr:hypothetical protein [Symploca sp. SIO1C2]NER93096.1 hypothetical protein [Symploca sp. SIO1B1]